MSVASPPRTVSLAEWDDDYSHREEAYELVDGVPIMTPPTESFANAIATSELQARLRSLALPEGARVVSHHAVRLGSMERATIRIPDVVVATSTDYAGHRLDAAQVALVAEVVSDSGVETDWVHKRDEYAAAGIPTYLIVDVRGDVPRIYAFCDASPDEAGVLRYAVPVGDGIAATVSIGASTGTIRAADLAP